MLNRLDDYPIHQTPEPLAHPAGGDRNAYDRYWFNGFTRDAGLFFGAALGLYPNRRVMDGAFSVVVDGVQHALHASRSAPRERTETAVGPLSIEVLEPMRRLRVRAEPNEHGIEADLIFEARTGAVEEPRVRRIEAGRVVMDATRFTQFGTWSGHVSVAGHRHALEPEATLGTRDRSWGVRPVGEPDAGPAAMTPQFFWLWAPLHFDDVCTHVQFNEDAEGRAWHTNGVVVPLLPRDAGSTAAVEATGTELMHAVSHEIRWQPATRRAASARLMLSSRTETRTIELEPVLAFQMRGLGYLHPEWGHGLWKGDLAVGGDSWRLDEIDPMLPFHLHVQQLCRARMGDREGIGVLEQLVIGPHAPSGFTSLLDPAA